MTKRFKSKRHCKDGKCHNLILDKPNHRFVLMLSSWEDCKDVTDVLNDLNDENVQLKSENLILKGKLHQLRLKCGKQEEEIECLSEETIEQFKQDLKDGKFIEYTAR